MAIRPHPPPRCGNNGYRALPPGHEDETSDAKVGAHAGEVCAKRVTLMDVAIRRSPT